MSQKVFLPRQFNINRNLFGNPIYQLRKPEFTDELEVVNIRLGRSHGKQIKTHGQPNVVVLRAKKSVLGNYEVLISPKGEIPSSQERLQQLGGKITWTKPKTNSIDLTNGTEIQANCEKTRESWKNQFFFIEEEKENNAVVKQGLRSAQIGALHATLGYWKTSHKPATIVMPTGTGKTETMISLLINQKIDRLLVVVPTDALRTQIAEKFMTLGLLKHFGVVGKGALYPVVGILEHKPANIDETEQYFRACNVVITTMQILNGFDVNIQKRISELCSHLFIDEAHHITAPTWEKFRKHFINKVILQFTATPFRSDGRHIDGKIIFNFPLKKAQDEGYFKPINFVAIREYNPHKHDESIAKAALKQLDDDISKNLEHLIMARVNSIDRAKEVLEIYKTLGSKYNPVFVNSKQTKAERLIELSKLKNKESRIIVCVDMLGEGFDMPELKIAAIHDIHKSLAITIQFTGRFARTKDQLGDATVIANVANADVEQALKNLYTEDADWNLILRKLSEGATGVQEQRSAFLENFDILPSEIPIQNILPKMSTVVYRTNCTNWQPEKIREVIKESTIFAGPTINSNDKVLIFVTAIREQVDWANLKDVYNTVWDLYIIHWNATQKLLYINSSNKGYHEPLAKAVAGDDVELVRGEQVFRTLNGINRLILMNLGLKSAFSRAARFTMHVGSDVREGLPDAQVHNKIKSNLFGHGYENGLKASIGCSNKGRIWAYRIAHSIPEWIEWCEHIGSKLLDNSISVEQVLDNAIIPEPITVRPDLVPLNIEWSEETIIRSEDIIQLEIDGDVVPFYEAGLELIDYTKDNPLKFKIFSENKSVDYEIKILPGKVEYNPIANKSVFVIEGKKRFTLSDWFQKYPPTIRFEDGTFLIYNEIFKLKNTPSLTPFSTDKINSWDWTGVNLSQESQTKDIITSSIQYKVIQNLLLDTNDPVYDIVFDDDDAYEAADIVAIKIMGERLIVHFYHCKFAIGGTPGARVEDLYAVCGQAQKSVFWKGELKKLINHLRKREITRINKSEASRFIRGDMIKLDEIENMIPYLIPDFKVFIVQPGLSKASAGNAQLTLLAATELYLQETYSVSLGVIGSA